MSTDTQLYMRVRGRVLGPYDRDKLQALSRRGQLSRMHELSEDGVTWVRAATYPELFLAGPMENALVPVQQQQPTMVVQSPLQAAPTLPASSGGKWYYALNGTQQGPSEFSHLQMLAATRQLTAEDMVWTDGMMDWCPAGEIAGLTTQSRNAGATAQSNGQAAGAEAATLPDTLNRAAMSSRPWVLFVTATVFVVALLFVIAGFFGIILGARERLTPVVASGIFNLVFATIAAVGGFLLQGYASKLGALSHSNNGLVLEKALDALRACWIFISILLIVMLAFVLIGLVLVFSEVVTLPRF